MARHFTPPSARPPSFLVKLFYKASQRSTESQLSSIFDMEGHIKKEIKKAKQKNKKNKKNKKNEKKKKQQKKGKENEVDREFQEEET